MTVAQQMYQEHMAILEGAAAHKAKVQGFFTKLAEEIKAPHYGDYAKTFALGLLQRAEQDGLYQPPPKEEEKK